MPTTQTFPFKRRLLSARLTAPALVAPPLQSAVVPARKISRGVLEVEGGQRFVMTAVHLGQVDSHGQRVGRVKLGYDAQTRQAWAFKKIRCNGVPASAQAKLAAEARAGQMARSPVALQAIYQTPKHVYARGPLMAGDCAPLRRVPRAEKTSLLLGVMRATLADLRRLHEARMVHRDIKPENIFHRGAFETVFLADFGTACQLDAAVSAAGTLQHMAPEQSIARLRNDTVTTPQAADVWGVGCSFIDMWVGNPFAAQSLAARQRVLDQYARWHSVAARTPHAHRHGRLSRHRCVRHFASAFAALPPEVRPLFFQLLHPDPAHRPSARQALQRADALFRRSAQRAAGQSSLAQIASRQCARWQAL